MDGQDHESFRQWLREHRKEYGYTQEELAQRVGCSVVTVRRIEEGVLRPSRQLAELIAAGLEVPPAERDRLVKWARTDPLKLRPSTFAANIATAATTSAIERAAVAILDVPEKAMAHPTNPYKGLRAFTEVDAPDFFGREALTTRLLDRLSEHPEDHPLSHFLAVVGPSGCGKSSLVRAGLLPALRHTGLPGGLHPVVVDITPGAHPFDELEAALLRIAPNPPPSLMEQLQADERGLIRAVKRVLPQDDTGDPGILLVIDQFEEVFTLVRDEAARELLLKSLRAAVMEPHLPLWVVVTLRADFYDGPLTYSASYELVRERTEVMGALAADELHRAIVAPAQRVGVSLQDELVATLEQDMGERPGALPLLEYTLTELFERRDSDTVTLEAYRATGGVQGALDRRAEEIYAYLDPGEQEETHQLFLRLVTLGEGTEDTRRRVRRAELASAARDEEALDRVLEIYGQARLLTFDRDLVAHGPTVEVAHEALIQAWGRLRDWLDSGRANLLVQRQLMEEAAEWARSGRDASYLASGARLVQFEALVESESKPGGVALTSEEKEYLQASVEESKRQEAAERERQAKELVMQKRLAGRLRVIVGGLAIFLVIAAALALFAFGQQAEATNQRNAAQANADRADKSAATAVANQNEAEKQQQIALQSQATAQANLSRSEAQRLAAEANRLNAMGKADPQLIGNLAIRSLNTQYTLQGDEALGAALALPYPRLVFTEHAVIPNVIGRDAWFSSDGKYVSSYTRPDVTAIYWDAQTGKEVARFQGDPNTMLRVAFLPDGKRVLSANKDFTLTIWDPSTHQPLHVLSGHTAPAYLFFSPDGEYILTPSDDKTVRTWDTQTGALLQTFTGHTEGVHSARISRDGKQLVTAGKDATVRVWDMATGKEVQRFTMTWSWDAVFTPDGKEVVLADNADGVLYDVATGTELKRLKGLSAVPLDRVAVSPDGKLALLGGWDSTARLWDLQTGQELRRINGHPGGVTSVQFAPDGLSFLTMGLDQVVALWDLQLLSQYPVISADPAGVAMMRLSHDGAQIATIGLQDSTVVRLWNASTGDLVTTLTSTMPLNWITFSPDDKTVATVADTTAQLWDATTGEKLRTFTEALPLLSVDFSPDGQRLLVVGGDPTGTAALLSVVDIATGKALYRTEGPIDQVLSMYAIFSPDGKEIFSTSAGGKAQTRDALTGREILHFISDTPSFPWFPAGYSADGRYVMACAPDVYVWDAHTGTLVRKIAGRTGQIYGCAFSPDGKRVLTSGTDNAVHIWDITSGQEIRRFAGFSSGSYAAIAFAPDGKRVAVGNNDGTVRFAPVDYQESMSWLCGKLWRDLTAGERDLYEIKDTQPTCPGK